MEKRQPFLPINRSEAKKLGWEQPDFVLVSGDAYVDHPSFGPAIISRVLEDEGFKVAMLSQPDFTVVSSMQEYGRPRLGFLIAGGNVDSMVAHYTVAKRRRDFDEYSPGGAVGKRPDRVVDVYAKLIRKAYPESPIIAGGLEASLRRFAHYDYWSDAVRPSICETSGVDMVLFGMGERAIRELAQRLAAGEKIADIRDLAGSAYLTEFANLPDTYVECASLAKVTLDKKAYARACRIQMDNQDSAASKPVVQKQDTVYLVQNVPAKTLTRAELDAVFALPYTRRWHSIYDGVGGVPALEEVEFSLNHNRGCFGGCNFCAITLHQGLRVTSRSEESVVAEAKKLTSLPGFKGYIHDVGGPTANFRKPSCGKQIKEGTCKGGKHCLTPSPCPHLIVDHSEYLSLLRRLRALPKVKKVFIRSGIRYDYMMYDKDESFFKELVEHHVSGQLKVAPEHCSPGALTAMAKPSIGVYNRFAKRFGELTKKVGKPQYLVPYLLSSHPGSTLRDAVALAEYLADNNMRPEQVQDFYPTPGTVATCMYYTGLDPYSMKAVYVPRKPEDKAMQRALLQYYNPKNADKVRRALEYCHREDLMEKLLPKSARRPTDRAGSAQTGDTGTGSSRTGASRTGSTRTGPSRTGSTRTGSTRTGASRTGAAKPESRGANKATSKRDGNVTNGRNTQKGWAKADFSSNRKGKKQR